jgi:3-hydroxybutyryl-CoA dehydrogenase
MGRQISAVFAASGARVSLVERDDAHRRAAREWIDGFLSEPAARDRVTLVASLPERSDSRLVIEAITEEESVKRAMLAALQVIAPDAVVASNSSSMPVARFVDDVPAPERLVNLHFYVRPWERRVVELMTSGRTTPEHLADVRSVMEALDFRVFELRKPGFGLLYNRIWAAVKREALAIVDEGLADPAEIDAIYRALEPQPSRGPFERMDAVGLDTVQLIESSYAREHGTTTSAVLDDLVRADRLGVKTGQGFYTYDTTTEGNTQ